MTDEDRDRLIRIETVLTEVVVPQLKSYGPRIFRLENMAVAVGTLGSVVAFFGFACRELAIDWLKRKMVGEP